MRSFYLRPLWLVAPSMDWGYFRMSLLRYSGESYRLKRGNLLLDLLLSTIAMPLIATYLVFRSKWRVKPNERVDILFETCDERHFKLFFKKIEDFLSGFTRKRAGVGPNMDYPAILDNYWIVETLPASLAMVILLPYLFFVSLFCKKNITWALARTCLVYYRTSYYFKKYPCRLFLTYADDKCSAAFYNAFKKAGGQVLCAFQNGIRFADEGIDYSCFDHFFPIGPSSVEIYKRANSIINRFTEIGDLALGNNIELVDRSANNEYDVIFVDQGFPFQGKKFWGFVGTADIETYLGHIRHFSLERSDLRLVYQLRNYDLDTENQKRYLSEWFAGTNVILRDGDNPMASYNAIAKSSVVVTACSTLGLSAIAMGKIAIFFNFDGRDAYNVISGSLQSYGKDYGEFADKIESGLQSGIGLMDVDITHYISRNTFRSPEIIASAIGNELCH